MVIQTYRLRAKIGHNMRIAVLSDLHDQKRDTVLMNLRRIKPDLIAIPGDLTNSIAKKKRQVFETLSECSRIAPSFYSLGNHEYNFTPADVPNIQASGAILLRNEYIRFGELCIGGLSSQSYPRRFPKGRYTAAPKTYWMNDFEEQKGYKILLCHHPEYYAPYLKRRNIDLILAGHAHGGQIRLFGQGLFAPGQGILPQYTHGIYDGRLVVSAGLCNSVPMIPRLGNPKELVIIELLGKPQTD